MMMVDLAVPRDIEAEVSRLPDVYLYTLDDLSDLVQAGKDKRLAAVGQAEVIIESSVQDFVRWLETRDTVPVIQALQAQAESWRAAEVQRARKLLAKGEDVQLVLEALSRGLTQKMMHGPMAGLNALEGEERSELSETLTKLFLRCPQRGRR
jgi:glutamyl-tRNA reductase